MSNLLQGKTVLITGASRGVGATLACALARQGASKLILVSEEGSQDKLHQVSVKLGIQTLAGIPCWLCLMPQPWLLRSFSVALQPAHPSHSRTLLFLSPL
jgi:NAD(P)-dependent dehydrogenase (short-subunit alcohol dehydrogenase family)